MILCPIVEGHGEVAAVPVLLRRLAGERLDRYDVTIAPPHRLPRGRILKDNEFERAAELARRRIRQDREGAIVVLLDADDECAAKVAARLRERLHAAVGDVPASVVLPTREYEAWFLAAARSLRGSQGVSPEAEPPDEPEAIRGAKEYFVRQLLVPGASYSETVDQAALTAIMSIDEAAVCRSFRKLCKDLAGILAMANC
jgi:hypothetical protein